MTSKKRKAFTLTELLVVVIVIGVLAAVTLPKFSKVLETRKTTEAEELMAAVRTEQEKRCALDKSYVSDFTKVNDIVASNNTKNFSYSLTATGMEAQSKSKGYTLKMPSYADGRLCCENTAECAKLNKNYPLCSDLTARADYKSGTECSTAPTEKTCAGSSSQSCGCKNGGTQTRVCNTTTGVWSSWGACSIADECSCSGPATQSCGCLNTGTKTRTCNTTTGVWGSYGACSVADACDCTAISGPQPSSVQQECNKCGTQTSSFACNASNGTWTESWGACSVTDPKECEHDCPLGKTWDGTACVCTDQSAKASCVDKPGFVTLSTIGSDEAQLKRVTIHYEWNDETCHCDCPSFGNAGHCDRLNGMMITLGEWDSSTCNCAPQEKPESPYYFKCVQRVVSQGGGLISDGSYSSKAAAQQACLSGDDPNAEYNVYLSGGGTDPNCRPPAGQMCPMQPAYYIKWRCSTEPPRPASGYGFDEIMCVIVQPHP